MPFTDKIVAEINSRLMAEVFVKAGFSESKLFEIGYVQARTDSDNKIDYLITGYVNGTQSDFSYDDSYPVVVYHRQLNTPVAQRATQFGDGENEQTESANMIMVVWADRDKTGMHESTLGSWLASTLNINFAPTDFTEFQVNKITVSATNINFDSSAVWGGEYRSQYPFGIETEYFSISYKIESTYSKDCFITCHDC